MAVLIAVPKVQPPRARRAGMITSHEEWRPMSLRRHRPRRRLRRGVRMAAWSLLVLLPTLGGGALGWSNLASRTVDSPAWGASATARGQHRDSETGTTRSRPSDGEPATAAVDVHSVLLESNEPVIGAPVADVEVSVFIPGYVLPDDSLEEPVHEGS
jgi:hypothetical protein